VLRPDEHPPLQQLLTDASTSAIAAVAADDWEEPPLDLAKSEALLVATTTATVLLLGFFGIVRWQGGLRGWIGAPIGTPAKEEPRRGTARALAVTMGLVSAVFFSLSSLASKTAIELHAVAPCTNLALRAGSAWLFAVADILVSRTPFFEGLLPRSTRGEYEPVAALTLFVRIMFGVVGNLLYFYGLSHLDIGRATAIFMTMPLWVLLIGVATRVEPLSQSRLLVMGVCFSGVLLVAHPEHLFGDVGASGGSRAHAVAVMVLSAMCTGAGIWALSQLPASTEPRQLIHAYMLSSSLIGLAAMLASGEWRDLGRLHPHAWVTLAVCGAAGFGSQYATLVAVFKDSAVTFALTQNVELVLNYAYDVAIFDKPVHPIEVAGSLLVVLSVGLLVILPVGLDVRGPR
jgi:drug/metabolite transporter (DMT)-like permease